MARRNTKTFRCDLRLLFRLRGEKNRIANTTCLVNNEVEESKPQNKRTNDGAVSERSILQAQVEQTEKGKIWKMQKDYELTKPKARLQNLPKAEVSKQRRAFANRRKIPVLASVIQSRALPTTCNGSFRSTRAKPRAAFSHLPCAYSMTSAKNFQQSEAKLSPPPGRKAGISHLHLV